MSTSPGLVFITGASSGIGQALARVYARQGWRLALVARRTDVLNDFVRAEGWTPDQVQAYGADVSRPEDLLAVARDCQTRQGLPDVVWANAGVSEGMDTLYPEDLQVMERAWRTNVLGVAATFQPFLQAMRERGHGTLVGVASVASLRGFPGHGAYCSSKAAVLSYLESLRIECRGTGVRVVSVLPGYVRTPLTAHNPYPMPFLMSAEDFAVRAFAAVQARRRSQVVIPWPMAWVARLLRVLPNPWFDALFAGRARKPRATRKPT